MRVRTVVPGLVVLAVLGVVLASALSGGARTHRLYLQTTDAAGALPGQDVRLAGRKVGRVARVEAADGGRGARIALDIEDTGWPVRVGSHLTIRWGGTVSYLKRYVAIAPGPADAASYTGGATLPRSALTSPVDFDTLINTFTPQARRATSRFIDRAGATLAASRGPLHAVIDRAPPALGQANALLASVERSRADLRTLIASTNDVVGAIRSADPSVEQAVQGLAGTLEETAQHTDGIQQTLRAAPGTLTRARRTLDAADGTLHRAADTTRLLAPGVVELRRTVGPLDSLLGRVLTVGPLARGTLDTARRSAPDVTRLLGRATALLPEVKSVADQAIPQLECIRPYTPDIVQIGTNWSGFISGVDTHDYYARVNPATLPFAPTNAETASVAEVAQRFPGVTVGFPRPPGTNAGQPWLLPNCGAGADALDPNKDAEARP